MADITKTIGGKTFKRSDFLVADDPEKSDTWHLPVRRDGKADRKLAAAAKAALTKNFRGSKYAGPDQAGALKKLKALYKAEGWDWGELHALQSDPEFQEILVEYYDVPSDYVYVPWGARSFADIDAMEDAQESANEVRRRTSQYTRLVERIIEDPAVSPKLPAIKKLSDEFMAVIGKALGEVTDAADDLDGAGAEPDMEAGEAVVQELAESEAGSALRLVEAAAGDAPSPLVMEIAIIQPGFGNQKDNHYYPKEVLARDAGVFVGSKMYETDHRPEEKSNRTWVSTVESITGFTETGAPIGRVVVHDPGFAERAKNLNAAGLLSKLECSILANGRARKGMAEGKTANVVEAITEAHSVDWVTRAGAGGHAMRLAETATGGTMPEDKKPTETAVAEGQKPADPTATQTAGAAQTVVIQESAPAAAPVAPAPQVLAEADVKAELTKTNLPAAAQTRLAARTYADEKALQEAIDGEIAYLKEITGSGKPLNFEPPAPTPAPSLAETNKRVEAVLTKYWG